MAVRILHLHSTFAAGGKEVRAVRLMNSFDGAARHTVLSAVPGALGARALIAPEVTADFPEAPALHGLPAPRRYLSLARFMTGFDLVLSYNWGAMDGVMAHRLLARAMRLPPLIHHEDGFNADEMHRRKRKRTLFRKAAIGTARALVVPSETLAVIAREEWGQDDRAIRFIANGVAVDRYAAAPVAGVIPGFQRVPGEVVIGTIAGLRPVKNLPRLVRAFAALGMAARLVIVGEGPEREAIAAEATALGVADRLVMPGFVADASRYVGHFDIFALSSDSEQAPVSLIEAMAAGLPIVTTDVGDICAMVSLENRRFVVPADDEAAFAAALARLVASRDLRYRVGTANREVARARYDERAMIAAYAALYEGAMGRPGALAID
ncbi:glycosyltransferase [Sphingomonas sp.]|uniref:glycosyltransferase n=1 Tax=Sphingomonas sp. TaxID=28214 RepID=UPI003AFF70A7